MDSTTVRELTKSVSSYFLNYLETDFKKQQTPGRWLQLQREGGLRVGLSLSRYAPLNAAFWSALASSATELEPINVSRRAYTSTLTDRFRDAVIKAVQGIQFPQCNGRTRALVEETVDGGHSGRVIDGTGNVMAGSIASSISKKHAYRCPRPQTPLRRVVRSRVPAGFRPRQCRPGQQDFRARRAHSFPFFILQWKEKRIGSLRLIQRFVLDFRSAYGGIPTDGKAQPEQPCIQRSTLLCRDRVPVEAFGVKLACSLSLERN